MREQPMKLPDPEPDTGPWVAYLAIALALLAMSIA